MTTNNEETSFFESESMTETGKIMLKAYALAAQEMSKFVAARLPLAKTEADLSDITTEAERRYLKPLLNILREETVTYAINLVESEQVNRDHLDRILGEELPHPKEE